MFLRGTPFFNKVSREDAGPLGTGGGAARGAWGAGRGKSGGAAGAGRGGGAAGTEQRIMTCIR